MGARHTIGLMFVGVLSGIAAVHATQNAPTTQGSFAVVDPNESIISEYTPEAPPNPTAPPYTLLRFNEDYHYLADPSRRTDLFDPLKYIPLNPSDTYSYLSLGGEIRERYENLINPGFGTFSSPAHESYLLQRITIDADLHVNPFAWTARDHGCRDGRRHGDWLHGHRLLANAEICSLADFFDKAGGSRNNARGGATCGDIVTRSPRGEF